MTCRTLYDLGIYFAVDARYSVNARYSVPALQLIFVRTAQLGNYTQGKNLMMFLTSCSSQDPTVSFDGVVDNMQKPNMFVIF